MINPSMRRLIEEIVQERVRAGAMFTAFDVRQEARRRGAVLFQEEVRAVVEEMFDAGQLGRGYDRALLDPGGPREAWLYHPYDRDPRSYRFPDEAPSPSAASPRLSSHEEPGLLQRLWTWLFGRADESTISRQPQGKSDARSTGAAPSGSRQAAAPVAQPASKTLDLSATKFLPISRDELARAARGVRLWASPWFGRRDLIPPADDPRTHLIDRALVTHGFLSPEQLEEIHRVGAEMDRLRPDILALQHQAAQAGEAAVQAYREEKARRKAEKKAEAAQRKRRRAEEIAHRRATDITFLGRGVSGRLGDRASDLEKLAALGLPPLSTPADVAAALGLTIPQLRWLAFHTEVATRVHYIHFTVPKRSGGLRTLSAPHRKLAAAQSWILVTLQPSEVGLGENGK